MLPEEMKNLSHRNKIEIPERRRSDLAISYRKGLQ